MGFDIISLLDRYGNNIRGHLVTILVGDDAVDLTVVHIVLLSQQAFLPFWKMINFPLNRTVP